MDNFYAALAGALVSLLGVLCTLRHNQKVHENNLKNEWKKQRDEREYRAKQDTLMCATEAVTRFLSYYLSIPDKTISADGSVASEITELGVAMNKLHFFCKMETIESSTRLSQILNEVVSEAMKAKMPAVFIGGELNAIDVEAAGLEKEISIAQEEIKTLLFSDPQSSLIGTHREQLAESFRRLSHCHGRRVELFKEQYRETEKCRDVVITHLKEIYEASRDVLLLAREELNFSIDENRYRNVMDTRIRSMEENYKKFSANIRLQVEDKMK